MKGGSAPGYRFGDTRQRIGHLISGRPALAMRTRWTSGSARRADSGGLDSRCVMQELMDITGGARTGPGPGCLRIFLKDKPSSQEHFG